MEGNTSAGLEYLFLEERNASGGEENQLLKFSSTQFSLNWPLDRFSL